MMPDMLRRLAALSLALALPVLFAAPAPVWAGEVVVEIDAPTEAEAEAAADAVAEGLAEAEIEDEAAAAEEMAKAVAALDKATQEYADSLMKKPPEGMTEGDVAMVFGNLYALGVLGDPDGTKAKSYLDAALAKGVPEAGVALGALELGIPEEGEGAGEAKGDHAKALEYYKNAADAGAVDAMRILGRFYSDGEAGFEKNPELGEKYLLQAAKNGDSYALNRLEPKFREAAEWEKANPGQTPSFPVSREAAVDPELNAKREAWNQRIADNIGVVYGGLEKILYQAMGMDYDAMQKKRDQEKKLGAAFAELADKAVESSADARTKGETAFAVGAVNAFGMAGDVDLDKAEKYYRIAADNGIDEALAALGELYAGGIPDPRFIAKENPALAKEYYEKAADKGVSRAMFALGDMYENGADGVPADQKKAIGYYRQATEWGDEDALAKMTALLADMPAEEREALQLPESPEKLVDPAKAAKTKERMEQISAGFERTQQILQEGMEKVMHDLEVEHEHGADKASEVGPLPPAAGDAK